MGRSHRRAGRDGRDPAGVLLREQGEEIGVTLHHPHGQIYGFPFVTPRTTQLLGQARAYARGGHGNLFDDVVASELSDGTGWWRATSTGRPSCLPQPGGRTRCCSSGHAGADLPALGDAARDAFCELYLDVLLRLDALSAARRPTSRPGTRRRPVTPLRRASSAAPAGDVGPARARQAEVPRRTESGMGVWINDVVRRRRH